MQNLPIILSKDKYGVLFQFLSVLRELEVQNHQSALEEDQIIYSTDFSLKKMLLKILIFNLITNQIIDPNIKITYLCDNHLLSNPVIKSQGFYLIFLQQQFNMRRFIISRVIPLGFNAESMMIKMVQEPFSEYSATFFQSNPYKYSQSLFYYNLAKTFPVNNFENQYEEELYKQSLGKLEQLNNLDEVMKAIRDVDQELHYVLHESQMKVAGSNFVSFNINVDTEQGSQIHQAVSKYQHLMKSLQGNQLWYKKAEEELGRYIHLLYNGLQQGKKQKLFKGFNKHEFFV